MAHIKNRDMLVNTMAAMIAGAIAYISIAGRLSIFFGGGRRRGGILAILALILVPFATMMVRLAVSRTREYPADEDGAKISSRPAALASGLERIESYLERKEATREQTDTSEKGSPTTSHLFTINPFAGANLTELFSTHLQPRKELKG